MATLSLVYDTGAVPLSRIIDAFASNFNYQEEIDGQPNPESEAAFAKRMVRDFIVDVVKSTERKAALAAAEATVQTVTLE